MYVRSSCFRSPRLLAYGLSLACLAASGAAFAAEPPTLDNAADLPELGEQAPAAIQIASVTPLPGVAHRLSTDMPVSRLCADPRAKAVLDSDLPGLTTRPEFVFFKGMSLKKLKALSGGRMTDADLAKVDAELAQLDGAESLEK